MQVTKMWCEWDIGINDDLFASDDLARRVAAEALADSGVEESLDDVLKEGLIGFDTVEVREE
jgi:hypothetical protein